MHGNSNTAGEIGSQKLTRVETNSFFLLILDALTKLTTATTSTNAQKTAMLKSSTTHSIVKAF
jgi:hypothetical protein